jgi:hypothetical protein
MKNKRSMKINFNNVRRQACFAYDRLCKKLNFSKEYEGYMLIDPSSIQKEMDDLRSMIGAIAMTHEEGNEDFQDIFEQEYPAPKSMESFDFKPEEDED